MDKLKMDLTCNMKKKTLLASATADRMPLAHRFASLWTIQTLEDNTVTIRHRDTMQQERVAADDLDKIIGEL